MTPAEMLRAARALEKAIAAAWASEAPDHGTTPESRALYAAMGLMGSVLRHVEDLELLSWGRPAQIVDEDPTS